jgi:hypothetical protein
MTVFRGWGSAVGLRPDARIIRWVKSAGSDADGTRVKLPTSHVSKARPVRQAQGRLCGTRSCGENSPSTCPCERGLRRVHGLHGFLDSCPRAASAAADLPWAILGGPLRGRRTNLLPRTGSAAPDAALEDALWSVRLWTRRGDVIRAALDELCGKERTRAAS